MNILYPRKYKIIQHYLSVGKYFKCNSYNVAVFLFAGCFVFLISLLMHKTHTELNSNYLEKKGKYFKSMSSKYDHFYYKSKRIYIIFVLHFCQTITTNKTQYHNYDKRKQLLK